MDGLDAEALNDEEWISTDWNVVTRSKLFIHDLKAGEVEKSASKRGMALDYVIPEIRSKDAYEQDQQGNGANA